MNILYLSCHSVLEYDELRILTQLGHKVFVVGAYMTPKSPHVNIRPPLNINSDQNLIDQYHLMCHTNRESGIPHDTASFLFSKEFLTNFDCVLVMHLTKWIYPNLYVFKDKLVILRTIGQNVPTNELEVADLRRNGIKILRYSPRESEIGNFAGGDGTIRFLKYKSDYKPRNNTIKNTISFGQSLSKRSIFCGGSFINYVGLRVPFCLYGKENETYPFNKGYISHSEQIDILASSSTYFYTGTYPAQYTLSFMEAMLSGIPIVSIGQSLNSSQVGHFPFEVPDILDKVGVKNHSNDLDELVEIIKTFNGNDKLNKEISIKQSIIAENLFSVEKNIHLWTEFFEKL